MVLTRILPAAHRTLIRILWTPLSVPEVTEDVTMEEQPFEVIVDIDLAKHITSILPELTRPSIVMILMRIDLMRPRFLVAFLLSLLFPRMILSLLHTMLEKPTLKQKDTALLIRSSHAQSSRTGG
jgi:hypothetical protein